MDTHTPAPTRKSVHVVVTQCVGEVAGAACRCAPPRLVALCGYVAALRALHLASRLVAGVTRLG
jgi:hypothetical protein